MFFRSHSPTPPLDAFVERLWFCSDAPPHARERIVPSGTVELVFNLHENEIRIYKSTQPEAFARFSGAVFSGTYSRFFLIDPRQHTSILGVHFRPGGAFPFLGASAGELANAHVDLEAIWGSAARTLRERLCAARSPTERFALVEAALLARLHHSPGRHEAVRVALATFESPEAEAKVREISSSAGLSHRHFIQLFTTEVGLTPKRYHRVRRFQRARDLAQQSPAPDWARIAVECGYFDQSHLIHDFQEFSGFTPSVMERRWSEPVLLNHVSQG